MEKTIIDLNCDVGEGIDNEAELLPLISSCNIACGGHAGNEASIRKVIRLAKSNNVKIGAHPSYPDKENFGRISMDIDAATLTESINDQLKIFIAILKEEKGKLHHIKPHGALYNDLAKNINLAKTFLMAIENLKNKCYLYVPYGSSISKEAKRQGFQIKYEAFADRNYNNNLNLVSRSQSDALIEDPKKVLAHLLNIAKNDKVVTSTKNTISIKADTFCVHGDTPTALQILMYLSKELPKRQVEISK